MPGFHFRYRLNGNPPTVETLQAENAQLLTAGDLLNRTNSMVALSATGDVNLLGAVREMIGRGGSEAGIDAVVDSDAVYAVTDAVAREEADSLDITGETGRQGVATARNGDLVVVARSAANEETLVRIGDRSHADHRPAGGRLNAALAKAVVGIYRKQLARGPTKAQVFFRDQLVLVLMHDVMTTAERTLVANGQEETVLEMRTQFHAMMRDELVAAVERLTGRTVTAFMSDNHVDPDLSFELFVLDSPLPRDDAS